MATTETTKRSDVTESPWRVPFVKLTRAMRDARDAAAAIRSSATVAAMQTRAALRVSGVEGR